MEKSPLARSARSPGGVCLSCTGPMGEVPRRCCRARPVLICARPSASVDVELCNGCVRMWCKTAVDWASELGCCIYLPCSGTKSCAKLARAHLQGEGTRRLLRSLPLSGRSARAVDFPTNLYLSHTACEAYDVRYAAYSYFDRTLCILRERCPKMAAFVKFVFAVYTAV